MKRLMLAVAVALSMLGFSTTGALAGGGCHHGCYQRDCCCEHRVCEPKYKVIKRKIIIGYRQDCYGCNYPVYGWEYDRVYVGQHCHSRCRDHGCDPYRGHGSGYGNDHRYYGDAFPGYVGGGYR